MITLFQFATDPSCLRTDRPREFDRVGNSTVAENSIVKVFPRNETIGCECAGCIVSLVGSDTRRHWMGGSHCWSHFPSVRNVLNMCQILRRCHRFRYLRHSHVMIALIPSRKGSLQACKGKPFRNIWSSETIIFSFLSGNREIWARGH
jgi:hypothetical protein